MDILQQASEIAITTTPEDTIENARTEAYLTRVQPLFEQIRAIAVEENAPCILAWQHRENWYSAFTFLPGHQTTEFNEAFEALKGKENKV